MNKLLQRQLKKLNLSVDSLSPEIQELISLVDNTYEHYEEDRLMVERSLDISSEELYRANSEMRSIVSLFPDIFLRINRSGVILDSSSDNSDILLLPVKSLVGKTIYKFPIKEIGNKFKQALEIANEKNIGNNFEYELLINDKKRFFEAVLVPLQIDKHVVFIRDITAKKEVTESLKGSEELFRKLTSSAQDSIIVVDSNGKITFWNNASENIFGYSHEEAIGKSVHQFLGPQRLHKSAEEHFAAFTESGKGYKIGAIRELTAVRKDGTEFSIEIALSALQLKGEWNSVGVIRDITERKMQEQELKRSKETAISANKAKSEFLANVSHEIRTPLNAILGFAELLLDKESDQKTREYLIGISTGGSNLLQLINDILDLSKIEAGRIDIKPEPINPHRICEEIKTIFSQKVREKNISLNYLHRIKGEGFYILDETRIRQVLLNIVGNAIKFTDRGGVTITLIAEENDDSPNYSTLIFEVADTGIGIPQEKHEVIFKEFYQVEGQSTRKYGGTGLGLAISKRLVEMMGGHITVKSKPSQGSLFTITLPGIEYTPVRNSTGFLLPDAFKGLDLKGKKVLSVEDNESNRAVIMGYLEGKNCVLLEACDGVEAVHKAMEHKPDLILMDIQMPLKDGYTAAKEIKSNLELKDIPIVALTASVLNDRLESYLDIFNGFLRKPVASSQLYSEISRVLNLELSHTETLELINNQDLLPSFDNYDDKLPADAKQKLLFLYKDVESTMLIDLITDFADSIIETATTNNIKPLKLFGETLEESANSFKIEKINQLLQKFPALLEKL